MKINKKILSLPPYLSTSWDYIATLRLLNTNLLVHLTNGETVTIPDLKPEVLETIFQTHVSFLEDRDNPAKNYPLNSPFRVGEPLLSQAPGETLFKIGVNTTDGMNAAMQHNPALAHSPDLPIEVLEKIGAVSKIIAPEDVIIPKAEPHCNCPYCQIARCIHGAGVAIEKNEEEAVPTEEVVSEEELQFQEWEISQSGDKLFTVVNKLDSKEKYSVYLGHPIGCTCGKEGCEHILAVLKS